jgi:DNA-binding IclR family transcriptional regulator
MQDKSSRRGIQSVEIAYRLLQVLQDSPQARPLKDIAAAAELTPSAANNYLVSLVRTGLAVAAERPGTYKLGPAALSLGMAAIQQIDAFDLLRREVTQLRDDTRRSAAVSTWTDDGVLSLFKQDGDLRAAFEMRTGLISLLATAAGKVFMACLPQSVTQPFVSRELQAMPQPQATLEEFYDQVQRELQRKKFTTILRADLSGYASISAPIFDFSGQARYAISLVGTRSTLLTDKGSAHVKALLDSAERATRALGGVSKV